VYDRRTRGCTVERSRGQDIEYKYTMMYQSNTTKLYYVYYCIEGPENDSVRIETCYPDTIINIIKFCCV